MMDNIVEVIPYASNGKDYEIKVSRIFNGFSFIVFLEGKPANCNRYKLESDNIQWDNIGMSNLEVMPYDRLIQIIKDDIDKGHGIPITKKE